MGEAISIERGRAHVSDELVAAVRDELPKCDSFDAFEVAVHRFVDELARRVLGAELQAIADSFGDEVTVEQRTYRRRSEGTVAYHTLCGSVAVRRGLYRLVGVHNGPTVVPLELAASLQENATPALAFSITQAFAAMPLREYEATMAAAHRVVPSRSTLERVAKRTGAEIEDALAELEPTIRASEPRIAGVRSISTGLDRTTVPMAEPIPDAEAPEPRIRRRPVPVTVAYRMAYVGTVSLHDADGRVLVTKRFDATANEGPDRLVERIAAELEHQQRRYAAPISVIQDGAPELWRLMSEMSARRRIALAGRVIDRFHVDERLAQVCEIVLGTGRAAREVFDGWRYQLDHSDTAIDRIIRHLDALVGHTQFGAAEGDPPPSFWFRRGVVELDAEALAAVSQHLEYFRRYRREIRYATRRRAGLPIGSGATEGACKSLIAQRCKRSGQRWFESGLAPCLTLRALHLSDRLRAAFVLNARARSSSLEAA